MIYFILSEKLNCIKIGYTSEKSAIKRFHALSIATPDKLILLATITHGQQYEELLLHKRFKHLHIKGEWFRAEQELFDFINGISNKNEEEKKAILIEIYTPIINSFEEFENLIEKELSTLIKRDNAKTLNLAKKVIEHQKKAKKVKESERRLQFRNKASKNVIEDFQISPDIKIN